MAAGPGVSHLVDFPILLEPISMTVMPCVNCIRTTTENLARSNAAWRVEIRYVAVARSKHICLHPLSHNLFPIDGSYDIVACTMKNNRRDDTSVAPHSFICCMSLLYRI